MPETPDDWQIIKDAGPNRRFSGAAINAAIDSALSTLPADGHGAVVAVADTEGAKLVGIARINDNWSVLGVIEKEWKGDFKASAAVRYAW